MHRSIGVFKRHNTESEKDVDLCALKIHNSFITNQGQVFPRMIFPTNCFQSRDLILLTHQSCRYVEHVFEWDLLCSRWIDNCSGNPFPWILLIPLWQSWTFSKSKNVRLHLLHRWKFSSVFSALDHSPCFRMILIPLSIPILFHRFSMTNCCGLAPLRGSTSGLPNLSRGITSFTTDLLKSV